MSDWLTGKSSTYQEHRNGPDSQHPNRGGGLDSDRGDGDVRGQRAAAATSVPTGILSGDPGMLRGDDGISRYRGGVRGNTGG